jgi:hypothetical protein
MDDQFECDGGSMRTSARMLPWKILNAQCGRHVRVAKVIVNNNPEAMKRSRRSFRTAAGWCFARTQHASARLASFGQNDGRVRLAKMPRARSSSSLETRAHAFEFAERLRMRAPQDEGERGACSPSSRCQTAHLVPAAHFCARVLQPCFTDPERGVAERRETFGCVRGTRWACP